MPGQTPEIAPASVNAQTQGTESTADLEGIAAGFAATMPEVQEHAIQQAADAQQAAQVDAKRDKDGKTFDPSIHATNDDGSPKITVRGTFALKRGRKGGSATASTIAAPRNQGGMPQASALGAQQAQNEQMARAAGIQAAGLVFATGVILGGEEWRPRIDPKIGLDEKMMIEGAMGDYFVSSGKRDIPPGVVLAFVLLAYAAPRFTMPATRARFGGVVTKVKTWWVNRKLRKAGLSQEVKAVPAKDTQTGAR